MNSPFELRSASPRTGAFPVHIYPGPRPHGPPPSPPLGPSPSPPPGREHHKGHHGHEHHHYDKSDRSESGLTFGLPSHQSHCQRPRPKPQHKRSMKTHRHHARPFPGPQFTSGPGSWNNHPAFGPRHGRRGSFHHYPVTSDSWEPHHRGPSFYPSVDLFESPDSFQVYAHLPGAQKENINVTWCDDDRGNLSISGTVSLPGKHDPIDCQGASMRPISIESAHGRFHREIFLCGHSRGSSPQIDAAGITAKLEDGILAIEVPKIKGGDDARVIKVEIK